MVEKKYTYPAQQAANEEIIFTRMKALKTLFIKDGVDDVKEKSTGQWRRWGLCTGRIAKRVSQNCID